MLARAHPDAQDALQLALVAQLGQAAEGVEIRGVVADVHGGDDVLVAQQLDHPDALVDAQRRTDLEHLAAPMRLQPRLLGRLGDLLHRGVGLILVGSAAPVQGGDRLLVLEADAQAPQRVAVVRGGERLDLLRPALQLAVGLGPGGPRAQHLAAVGA